MLRPLPPASCLSKTDKFNGCVHRQVVVGRPPRNAPLHPLHRDRLDTSLARGAQLLSQASMSGFEAAAAAAGTAPSSIAAAATREVTVPGGQVVIRPIGAADVEAASVVITRAFAGSSEAVKLEDVLKDIESLQAAPDSASPQGLFLIARFYPSDPSVPLPPGQDSRLIGTATLSLAPTALSIQRLPDANRPSKTAAYVSNMAVDSKFRRQGVARALLAACEGAAVAAGRREVWLHVREADAPARALYVGAGYQQVAKDSWMDTMMHKMRPRLLMRRNC